jgi:hypothetical protein
MSYLLQDPLKLLAPAVVVAFLAYLMWQFNQRYRIPARKLSRELDACTRRIVEVRSGAPGARRAATAEVFDGSAFSHHWNEFQETLHDQFRDMDGEHVVARTRATASASHYFSAQSVVDTPLRTEYFRHLPGILTGLGIIGTFLGLMLGLSNFDPGALAA